MNEPRYLGIYQECMRLSAAANPESVLVLSHKGRGKSRIPDPNITQWIHLSDAVERGSIQPLEAWNTIKLGYVAEHLKVRDSRYKDRI